MHPESQKPPEQRARDMARLCAEELLKDPDDERVITGIFRNIPLQQLIEASDKCTLLEQQLAEARKDTELLTWLDETNLTPEFYLKMCGENNHREFITLAMKEKGQSE